MNDQTPQSQQRQRSREGLDLLEELFARQLKKNPNVREEDRNLRPLQRIARDLNRRYGDLLSPDMVDKIVLKWFKGDE